MKSDANRRYGFYRMRAASAQGRLARYAYKVEQLLRSGRFWQLAQRTQESMRAMLSRLYRRLTDAQARAFRRIATGLLVAALLLVPSVRAAADSINWEWTRRDGVSNPINGVSLGSFEFRPYLSFADLDGDGDLDLAVGSMYDGDGRNGVLRYYRNDGDASSADFQLVGVDSPLAPAEQFAEYSYAMYPAFVDIDEDGDQDLVVGGYFYYSETWQAMQYFENTGEIDAPQFINKSLDGNPFPEAEFGETASPGPEFADMDGDGDLDVFFTSDYTGTQGIAYYKNTSTDETVSFVEEAGSGNPFYELSFYTYPRIGTADVDNDGDQDVAIGRYYGETEIGQILYYQNDGDDESPMLVQKTGADNPFDGLAADVSSPQPTFVDIDGDGDLDLFAAGSDQDYTPDPAETFAYYENTADPVATYSAQSVTNAGGQQALVQSNKFAGSVYIILDGESAGSVSELDAAVAAGKGAKADVTQAVTATEIDVAGAAAGTYYGYAVDGAGNVSAAGGAQITITGISYPAAAGDDSTQAWIESVTIGPDDFESGDDGGYAATLDSGLTAARGAQLTITLVPGFTDEHRYYVRRLAQQRFAVYIDANIDGDFDDPGEKLLSGGPTIEPIEAQITIPAGAVTGSTRLRVVMQYHELGEPASSGTIDFGEVEDYSITVTE